MCCPFLEAGREFLLLKVVAFAEFFSTKKMNSTMRYCRASEEASCK